MAGARAEPWQQTNALALRCCSANALNVDGLASISRARRRATVPRRVRLQSPLDSVRFRTNESSMSLHSRLLAAGAALSLVISACAGLGRPSVTPQTPEVTGVSTSGLELGVDLKVDNPNPFPLVANEVKGTLFLAGDKRVGTGSASLDKAIDAKASGNVQSRLDIAWSSASALKEFVGKSTVPYTFKGELGVSGGPVNVSVPFELRGELHRDQIAALGGSLLAPLLK